MHLAARSERLSRWIDGTPTVIVRNGAYDDAASRRMALRRAYIDRLMARIDALAARG